MDYQVGQVLYTCNQESLKIIPLQVVEIVTRVTIEGSQKEYVVLIPDGSKTTTPLSNIKGSVFTDIESIRSHLVENATKAIDEMINVSEKIINKFFKIKEKQKDNQKENGVQVEKNNDIIMVDLGDGVKAKMSTSSLERVVKK
jgi:hypothetical protein